MFKLTELIQRERIAIIGAGVAGIVSAYLLQNKYDVTLFEKNEYVGGHTNTVLIPNGPDAGLPVDTGFIVFNSRTYPYFEQFLAELEVEDRNSTMSFSYFSERSGLYYAGTSLNGLFAQRRNLIRPYFWRMLNDLVRFNKQALLDADSDKLVGLTLGDYVRQMGLSKEFMSLYLLPMGAAIWSTPTGEILNYPAQSFIHFFRNHGLLTVQDQRRLQWKTVKGGSNAYVKAFLKSFKGTVVTGAKIDRVRRTADVHGKWSATICHSDGREESFDRVVFGTHANEALQLLEQPTPMEHKLLGAWNYSKNHTVLHTDISVLPPSKKAWAAWNYTEETKSSPEHPVSVSYYMNALQGLNTPTNYCVTLNRTQPIKNEHIIREMNYTHPVFSFDAINSQTHLPTLNGGQATYYCGSYFGYGFHEDAVRSSVQMVNAHFDVIWPALEISQPAYFDRSLKTDA